MLHQVMESFDTRWVEVIRRIYITRALVTGYFQGSLTLAERHMQQANSRGYPLNLET